MKHGHASNWNGKKSSYTYSSWRSLIQRCKNPNHKWYKGYKDKFYDPWSDFQTFLKDMGERPLGFSLDRIDNSKPYSPENCRWADASTQLRNKSTTKLSLEIAKEIRKLYNEGLSSKEIQVRLNLSKSLVGNVLFRGDWKET